MRVYKYLGRLSKKQCFQGFYFLPRRKSTIVKGTPRELQSLDKSARRRKDAEFENRIGNTSKMDDLFWGSFGQKTSAPLCLRAKKMDFAVLLKGTPENGTDR